VSDGGAGELRQPEAHVWRRPRSRSASRSAAGVAVGHEQLVEVERAWRETKTRLDLRPVYRRHEERIRSHLLLGWFALLRVQIAENATAETWRHPRRELERLDLRRFAGPAGPMLRSPGGAGSGPSAG
jgi:hypothetical protein